ncbi:velvet factor-domain-containing protein [Endogone sp. FLAS-F59071]|nr:velvet factor-domain-containing protein [Endogone sp. FLAS-F59071]|eukprot:RUS17208.1 velvet factor-domain-containing protein [Endogone sp. FLAS-F59071]
MIPFRPQNPNYTDDQIDQSFVPRSQPLHPFMGNFIGLSDYGNNRPAQYQFGEQEAFYYQPPSTYIKPMTPVLQTPSTTPLPPNTNRTESQVFSELTAMAYGQPQTRGGGGWSNRIRYPVDQMHFRLEVVQQPLRARMCGFGDKDRRPITPPPILQLKVYDQMGYALDVNYVDTSFYVVMCDLWSADAMTEANLVVHRSANSAISTTSPSTSTSAELTQPSPTTPTSHTRSAHNSAPLTSPTTPTSTPTMVSTRNLIGSVVSSAAKLFDTNRELGIYFVFQDLSVRTEGTFRLRFSFMDVGSVSNGFHFPWLAASLPQQALHERDPYSPDQDCRFRFHGAIYRVLPQEISRDESTPLSRCFAKQGIKIPIRKDSSKARKSEEDLDDLDDDSAG